MRKYKPTIKHTCEMCGAEYLSNWNSRRCPECRPGYAIQYRETYAGNNPKTEHSRYLTYKDQSENKRGIEFTLSEEQYWKLKKEPCYYCGYDKETIGIDRMDSQQGYTPTNCVPCCYWCNMMKYQTNMQHFIARCVRIAERLGYNKHC